MMDFAQLQKAFNRASAHAFSKKKLGFVSIALALCGLLVVFCRGLALDTGSWLALSLAFLPIFLCTGLLASIGIILIRLYHDEVKGRHVSVSRVIGKSWHLIVGTAYLSAPLLLTYLLLWVILGIFFLLREIPTLGSVISSIFSFGPFLLILGSLWLAIATFGLLFFPTPALALGTPRAKIVPFTLKRLSKNLFANLLLLAVGIAPTLLSALLLILAVYVTDLNFLPDSRPLYMIVYWFFIMLPFTALLSPAVIFFFNFAAEAHLLMRKERHY